MMAPAACLVLVTACGSDNTASSADQSGHSSGGSPTNSTPTQSVEATSVTVHRTGGIAGTTDSWTVKAGKPGDLSPRAAEDVLRIASSPAFKAIDATKPKQVCCDFFNYAVTVHYSDGSQLQLHTNDSSPQPAPLTRLLGFFA
jgi:hypothetical protein